MSKNKRSDYLELNKCNATALFKFIITLRRFDLADNPSGIYHDVNHVFSVWEYARAHGVTINDTKDDE